MTATTAQPQPAAAAAAAAATAGVPPKLSSQHIMPFINSTRQVLQTMANVKVEVQKPSLKVTPAPSYDVTGIIGISGDIVGSIVVSFRKETAEKIVAAFVGSPLESTSPDFSDAVGELTNMIAGSAKKDLGGNASISVPTVIIGAGHMVARMNGVPCVVLPCKTEHGEFAVELNIKPTI